MSKNTRLVAPLATRWASHDNWYPRGYKPVEIYCVAPDGAAGRLNAFSGENSAVANEADGYKAAALRSKLVAQAHRNKQGWHGLFPQHHIEIRGL